MITALEKGYWVAPWLAIGLAGMRTEGSNDLGAQRPSQHPGQLPHSPLRREQELRQRESRDFGWRVHDIASLSERCVS